MKKAKSQTASSSSSSSKESSGSSTPRIDVQIYASQARFFSPYQEERTEDKPKFKSLVKALNEDNKFYNFSKLLKQAEDTELQKIDSHGRNLLHYAAKNLRTEAIYWLLQRLDVNRQSHQSKSTPLMILIQHLSVDALSNEHFVKILKLFIQASDLSLANAEGKTVQTLAKHFANHYQLHNKEKFLALFDRSQPTDNSASEYSHSVKALIAKPKSYLSFVSETNNAGGGYAEEQGLRPTQEDALIIDANIDLSGLNHQQIGERLWSTFRVLDHKLPAGIKDGSTAATVVCDVERHLITSGFVGDASSFAAVYDKKGKVIGVKRLNEMVDHPNHPLEEARIQSVGGQTAYFGSSHRVLQTKAQQNSQMGLTISRAIGDRTFKPTVCADPHIYQTSFEELASDFGMSLSDIGKIQIICTCDGYTDAAGRSHQSKEDHEALLLRHLRKLTKNSVNISEEMLAGELTELAISKGSRDNVSVAIQTIDLNTSDNPANQPRETLKSFFIGVFDGHNGSETASYLADNFGRALRHQVALPQEKYQEGSRCSVYESEESKKTFFRDNPQFTPLAQDSEPSIGRQEEAEDKPSLQLSTI